MLRLVWGQLLTRPGRAVVLAVTILAATGAFVLLTATGRTTEVRVEGSVESNYRTAYDILVRPRGSATPLERSSGLVRNNYLSGLFGGISMQQWREIKALPGVDVAAPIANVGFIVPRGSVVLRFEDQLTDDPIQLYRVRFETRGPANERPYQRSTHYIYYNRVSTASMPPPGYGTVEHPSDDPDAELRSCAGFDESAPESKPPYYPEGYSLACYFERSPGMASDSTFGAETVRNFIRPGQVGTRAGVSFPLLIAGVDPEEEARLVGLDQAVAAGRYLRQGEGPTLELLPPHTVQVTPPIYQRRVPVIASSRTYHRDHIDVQLERLTFPAGTDVPRTLASARAYRFLTGLGGSVVRQTRIEPNAMYEQLLLGDVLPGKAFATQYWTTSAVHYQRRKGEVLRPATVENPLSIWSRWGTPADAGDDSPIGDAPPASADVQFRRLKGFPGSPFAIRHEVPGDPEAQVQAWAFLRIVGRYDPEKLRGFSPLSQVPLETYYPPVLRGADERTRRALDGGTLGPTGNLGDYVAQPPLLLTTLEGMRPFLRPRYYRGASEATPISVVRVRVQGVSGSDEVSQTRIRNVAAQIRQQTGLDVDITAGSSPRRLLVELPPGKFGRPSLLLEEGWSKKGVSVAYLEALDRKRLGLFLLVLAACGFFVGNAAFAVVRARRREIGTLLCLGWSQRTIFRWILGELAAIGLLAGVAGAFLAWQAAHAFELEVALSHALLVVPLALGLTLAAGFVPAYRASRSRPLDAVRPLVGGKPSAHRVRGLPAMARANVRRAPARTAVAAGGLAVGVATIAILLAVNNAFEGSMVGTILGEAISIQVRTLDFVAAGLVIALSGISLADVLYMNLRDRAAEIATLRTFGWRERDLGLVIALEAFWIGLFGGLMGAAGAVAIGFQLGVPLVPLLVSALGAAVGGIAVALVASLVPLVRLGDFTPSSVLAED